MFINITVLAKKDTDTDDCEVNDWYWQIGQNIYYRFDLDVGVKTEVCDCVGTHFTQKYVFTVLMSYFCE